MRIIRVLYLVLLAGISVSCKKEKPGQTPVRNYKQEMKNFVQDISAWAHTIDPGFMVIPQNGHELITVDGKLQGDLDLTYLAAIDGQGREDLIFGYNGDDVESPTWIQGDVGFYLQKAQLYDKVILVTDYCYTPSKMDTSYSRNHRNGFISFSASHRNLDNIPAYPVTPFEVNNLVINRLDSIHNFLYLLDPESLGSKTDFITTVKNTNYDMLITDLFMNNTAFTPSDMEELKIKKNGGVRLLFVYMSIGEAEDYRYYWDANWKINPPSWLKGENPDWQGNYKVAYWEKSWQDLIFGNDESYLKKILNAGFDGVYLDIIDAFEYFEEKGE